MLPRRRIRLTLGDTATGQGIVVEDLRIDFEVKKLAGGAPNIATIKVWNLAAERRAVVDSLYTKLILEVSTGTGFSTLYVGEMYNVITNKDNGTDVVTSIFCGSGLNGFQNATVHKSFNLDVGLCEVVKAIGKELEAFGIGTGSLNGAAVVPPGSIGLGSIYSGTVRDMLDKALSGTGLNWSIEDDRLEILENRTESTSQIFVTPDSGLIGSVRKTQLGYDFTSVLNPAIRSGVTVGVFSEFVESSQQALNLLRQRVDNGGYVRPISIVHKGTNHIGPATTEVTGVR